MALYDFEISKCLHHSRRTLAGRAARAFGENQGSAFS